MLPKGVQLVGYSANVTTIKVNYTSRSIAAIRFKDETTGLIHWSSVRNLRITRSDAGNDPKRHVGIAMIKTQMCMVESVQVDDLMTGIQVTHWSNRIINSKFENCGMGIQLSGKPLVKSGVSVTRVNDTSVTIANADNWGIYPGQYLWQTISSRLNSWLITSIAVGGSTTTLTLERNYGSDAVTTQSSSFYYIDFVTDKRNSGGDTYGSIESTVCTVLGSFCSQNIHYGIFVKGLQNAIINCASERFDVPYNNAGVTGIFVAKGSEGCSIMNCYFEMNKKHIVIEGDADNPARGTSIMGCYVVLCTYQSYGETWIEYGTNADRAENGNTDFNTSKRIYTDEARTVIQYEHRSSIMRERLGVGTVSPGEKLHVYDGNAKVEQNYDGETNLKIRNTNASGAGGLLALEFDFGSADNTRLTQSNGMFEIGFNTKLQLRRRGLANPALYIDADSYDPGNIGLGTTSVPEKLVVNGGIKVGDTSNTNDGTIRFHSGALQVYQSGGWKTIQVS